MTLLQNFKNNLKIEANRRQQVLFAQADELEARARESDLGSMKRARLVSKARQIREDAYAIGDTYHRVMA